MKKKYFFASLKSMRKGVETGVGSGSIRQRYRSGDPDPHQNVTDPQHCLAHCLQITTVWPHTGGFSRPLLYLSYLFILQLSRLRCEW